MSHTPGPWRTGSEGFIILGRDDWLVADCQYTPLRRDENRANARLIAAAPSLLQTLEDVRDDIALLLKEGGRLEYYDFSRIDAVIAEAKGEQK